MLSLKGVSTDTANKTYEQMKKSDWFDDAFTLERMRLRRMYFEDLFGLTDHFIERK